MNNERYKSTIGFTDLLFNILVGFAFLFIIAFLLIKPEAKKEDFERKAEYVIIMEWDHDAPDDIDLYVEDPLKGIVSFRHPTMNQMHLDKDDLGSRNDTMLIDGVPSTISINREVVTIRGIARGEYIVNGHYYSNRSNVLSTTGEGSVSVDRNESKKKNKDGRFLTVKVEVHKVNPYSILWIGEKKFDYKGQEETFVRFRLTKTGNIIPPFTYQEKKFVAPNSMGNVPPGHESSNSGPGSTLSFFSSMQVPSPIEDDHEDDYEAAEKQHTGDSMTIQIEDAYDLSGIGGP